MATWKPGRISSGNLMLGALTPTQQLLIAAGATTSLLWLALLGAVAVATRARDVQQGPRTSELRDEPPAVVALITNGWRVPGTAAAATLLDLAARHFLDVEQYGSDRVVCRLRPSRRRESSLADYEDQVLQHVEGKAVDGTVPAEALTTGREDVSSAWWRSFRSSVIDDARRRGLSRPRWSVAVRVVIAVAALVPAAAWALAAAFGSKDWGLLFMGVAVWVAAMWLFERLNAERDTPQGRKLAAYWLGVRDYIDDAESFEELPGAAVAVWDRYLAIAVALGVAHRSARELPMRADDDRRALVHSGGRWRTVRVSYPFVIWPPGWGLHPVAAIGVGLMGVLVVATVGWGIVYVARDVLAEASLPGWARLIGVALLFIVAAAAAWVGTLLVRAIAGLAGRQTVEGKVLRARAYGSENETRRYYLAVDDGHSDRIRAWHVQERHYDTCDEGNVVRAVVYPYVGWVSKLEVAGRPEAGTASPGENAAR